MTTRTEKSVTKQGYVEHTVDHFQQRWNWDCGVSCVLMVLTKDQREKMLANFEEVCREEGFGQSTWTIDLCYLLKRYGVKHVMYTTLLGVNEDYRRHGYYDKIMHTDRERVTQRFLDAAAVGVEVVERSLSTEELVRHVVSRGPALLLVDAGLLVCDLCKHNKLKAEFRRCFGGGYTGHYILVVGHRGSGGVGKLLYRDPALSARLCAVSYARMNRARLAPGTDQDIILLYNR